MLNGLPALLDSLESAWEARPLYQPGAIETDFFSTADLEARLRFSPATPTDVVLNFFGKTVSPQSFRTGESAVNYDAVQRLHKGGATIIANRLQNWVGPVQQLIGTISNHLGVRANCNLYCTPPMSRGFDIHVDLHDVLVVQVAGSKEWYLYGEPYRLPNKRLAKFHKPGPGDKPREKIVMSPGDVLYLPRGEAHAAVNASTSGQASVHLTIGLHPQTLHSLLIELVDLAAFEDIELRKTAPQELTPGELVGRLNKTVESLKGEVPTKKYSAGNTQANWPSLQISTGDLDKYRWADPGDTIVTAKKDRVRVSSPTRTIELLRELDSVLDRIICGDVFEVASLNHSHPKLLCHHLARNGFLIPISRS